MHKQVGDEETCWTEPGKTPGRAEGDDPDRAVCKEPGKVANPDADRPDYHCPDPGRTPGQAEG